MTTLVGTQSKFSDALKELLELEYNAVETYTAVINRLENESFKDQLKEFLEDHNGHINELEPEMKNLDIDFKSGPSGKQVLMIGEIALRNLFGDKSILQALVSAEEDTNTAYERMNKHVEKSKTVAPILKKAWEDEKRHLSWLQDVMKES